MSESSSSQNAMKITKSVLALTPFFASALSPNASAATLTHFNYAVTNAGDLVDGEIVVMRDLTSDGSTASISNSGDSFGRPSIGSAEANLGSGILRASSTLAFSSARFGDSFRAATPSGSPFSWTADDTARFSLNITGSIDRSSSGSNFSDFVILILEPGALNAYTDWLQQTGPADAWTSQLIDSLDLGLDYETPLPDFYDDNLTSFPGSYDFDFSPEGDFDWVLSATAFTNGGVTADFSNTFEVSYTGPDGSVTRSASGAFPGTVAIPEPSSALLLVAGIGALHRRRRPKMS